MINEVVRAKASEIRPTEPKDPGPVTAELGAIQEIVNNISSAIDELEKAISPILGPSEPAKSSTAPKGGYGVLLADQLGGSSVALGDIRDRLFAIKRRVGL